MPETKTQKKTSPFDMLLWNLLFRGTEPYRPKATTPALPAYTRSIFERPEVQAAGIKPTPGATFEESYSTPQALQNLQQAREAQKVLEEETKAKNQLPVRYDTIFDEDTGIAIVVGYDKDGNVVSYEPTGQRRREEEPTVSLPEGRESVVYDAEGNEYMWSAQEGRYLQTGGYSKEKDQSVSRAQGEETSRRKWEEDMFTRREAAETQRQSEMIQWYQQQAQMQAESEKQRLLSTLRANPASWLEYASVAGQTPVVQPWMKPLGAQGLSLTVGSAVPGYQAGGKSMNLPELGRPGAQYMTSLAPSARQQYYGYEQARTGARPEDTQWQLWSGAPPGGQFGGLRRLRY